MAEQKLLNEENEEEKDIFYKRASVDLTPKNAKFTASKGNLISLELTNDDGKIEFFERIVAIRAFPITDPDYYISIREPDGKNKEKGAEIGLIEDIHIFDAETVQLLNSELDRRYFTPKIQKVVSLKEKLGQNYWEVVTDAGEFKFVIRNSGSNIRTLEDGRMLLFDIDGNCFEIPDPEKLDKASFKKIEIYL